MARDADKKSRQRHWEDVHAARPAAERSWFEPVPLLSLALIEETAVTRDARIIDVGGGTSLLVDELVERGFRDLSVLDISAAALDEARARLGAERAGQVRWIHADITTADLPGPFDLWHDRAVFHFLADAGDRRAYVAALAGALRPHGHAIIATFAEDGPTTCSGLPVVRYSPATLAAELGHEFIQVDTRQDMHRTPGGTTQHFVYVLFRRRGP